jgi:voltage-gated potassium channel Kch
LRSASSATSAFASRLARTSVSDAVYSVAQLFTLQASLGPHPPWQLEVARLIAPLLVGYAALAAVLALFREQVELLKIRLLSDHVIVAGLGERGSILAEQLFAAGLRVVGVDRDSDAKTVERCAKQGIPVVRGDGVDPAVLDHARIEAARHLVVMCDSDAINVRVALAAAGLAREHSSRAPLTVIVHLDDFALWRVLKAETLRTSASQARLEFTNLNERAAELLLDRFPLEPTGREMASTLVVGTGDLAEALLLHAAYRCSGVRFEQRPLIIVIGPDADAFHARVSEAYPRLEERLDVRFVELAAPSALETVSLGRDGHPIELAFICFESDANAIKAAFWLRQRDDFAGKSVLVLNEPFAAFPGDESLSGASVRFPVLESTLNPDLLGAGTTERLARAAHEHYVATQTALGSTREQNPSLVPWAQLPEPLKDSNRHFADGVGTNLAELGLIAVPLSLAANDHAATPLSDSLLERLAEAEHERWASDLKGDGWRPTREAKDAGRKLHPLLVPWSELDEAEREKDREPIRALPAILDRAGFRLARFHTGGPP